MRRGDCTLKHGFSTQQYALGLVDFSFGRLCKTGCMYFLSCTRSARTRMLYLVVVHTLCALLLKVWAMSNANTNHDLINVFYEVALRHIVRSSYSKSSSLYHRHYCYIKLSVI